MSMYDLIDSPWLPLRPKGETAVGEFSLRQALLGASEFDSLTVDLPTHAPALLRQVLLPVVMDALGRPPDRQEWARRFTAGGFTDSEQDTLGAYLDEHRARFDLFDAHAPFAQVGGLHTAKNETKGSALLVVTAAAGNNVPLFAARTEGDPLPLSPAQAARWLLHAHCWDTAAIKSGAADDPQVKAGKTMGNPTGPLGSLGVVLPSGRSLYETLLLNIPFGTQPEDDLPHWRREPLTARWQVRAATGLLDLWTWQSRRIRLIAEDTDDTNDSDDVGGGVRVCRVVLCAGDRLREVPEWEPHTTWSFSKAPKGGGTFRKPRRHTPGKAAWRGLEALLAAERQEGGDVETSVLLRQLAGVQAEGLLAFDYPLRVETIAITYGTQSAVVEDIVFDAIPLPVAALRADEDVYGVVLEVAEQAEGLARAVNNLSADLRRAAGADPIPWDKGQRPGEFVLHALDALVRRFLIGVRASADDPEVLERGRDAWEKLARDRTWEVAEKVLAGAAHSAFAGRAVEKNGRTFTYRLAGAEQNFRRQLATILTRCAPAADDSPGEAVPLVEGALSPLQDTVSAAETARTL
ncbi:type I-E CRISPR-associated protein Cse1/CasA [Streptosporangium sp. NPDC023615]|uniref:type I-E CRISPR-associated protein Cse1/CasA n=1 Tax=Streptosporangium sp. NPDC023615 TaxID=3154794 RepID=UPI00342C1940